MSLTNLYFHSLILTIIVAFTAQISIHINRPNYVFFQKLNCKSTSLNHQIMSAREKKLISANKTINRIIKKKVIDCCTIVSIFNFSKLLLRALNGFDSFKLSFGWHWYSSESFQFVYIILWWNYVFHSSDSCF